MSFPTMAAPPKLTLAALRRAGVGAFFRPIDLEPLGITEPMLRTLIRRGTIEKIARGLYRLVGAETSEHYAVAATCARIPNAIICLLTALQIHDIGTRLSPEIWIGIARGRRAPRSTIARLRVVRFSERFLTAGVEPVRIDGVPTRITNPTRTIIDCLRLPRLIDRETALEAAREGLRSRRVTASGLLRMARICGTFERVRHDLEVLNA